MENELSKKYYKIQEVSEILGVSQSTLRFWEDSFPEVSPKRNNTNRRIYTPSDIKTLKIIYFLLKTKGLKIEAAKEYLKTNKNNISKQMEIITRLTGVKKELQSILQALDYRKNV